MPPSRPRSLHAPLLVALCALLGLAACGGDDSGTSAPTSTGGGGSPTSTEAGTATDGGSITLAYASGAGCIDPHQLADSLTITVGRQITDGLTWQDAESGDIVPSLAESWEISDDGTSYTFHLRDGVTFSDGTPLDAAAVKANFDDIVALGAKSLIGSSYLAGVDTISVVDPATVKVVFKQPSAQFLQATSTATLGLLSPATLAADAAARCGGKLVGTGAFTLESYVTDQSVELAKRPDYAWGPPSVDGSDGPAHLDSVTFQVIREAAVRTGALQSGQVQGIENVQPVDQSGLKGGGFTILARSNPGMVNVLIPNVARPFLKDEAVRQALQAGIDRQTIIDTLWNDNYLPATSILASTTPYYVDESDLLAYDPDHANEILDDAGWVKGSDGIRTKDGQRLTLTILLGSTDFELLQQQVKEIGVDLQVKAIDPAQYVATLNGGDYDLAPYNLTRPDPSVLTALFSSTLQNVPHFTTGPLDAQLAKLSQVADPDERATIAEDVQQAILEGGYALPTTEQAQVYGFAPEVKGLTLEASSRLVLHGTYLEEG